MESFHKFDWSNKTAYSDMMAQVFYYVDHATSVLAYSAAKTTPEQKQLHQAFLHGIDEEGGHEDLAKNDIESLGYKLDQFPERIETSLYYQSLYYHIFKYGPDALIGYFSVLEGLAAVGLKKFWPTLTKIYKTESLTFLDEHIIKDQEHYFEGLERIAMMPESNQIQICKIGEFSARVFRPIVDAVIQDYSLHTTSKEQTQAKDLPILNL
jgi:hypothetical protein